MIQVEGGMRVISLNVIGKVKLDVTRLEEYFKPEEEPNKFAKYIRLVNGFLDETMLDVHEKVDGGYKVILPKENSEAWFVSDDYTIDVTIYQTFEDITVDELLLLKGDDNVEEASNALAVIGNATKNELRLNITSAKAEVEAQEKELENQLKLLQIEASKQVDIMRLKMAGMMRPLINTIEGMTDQLHIFESHIYSTLSFMGMTTEIKQIAKGTRAPEEEPLVIWQELRYLDEELPKLHSIYDVNFEDFKVLEKIITDNEIVRDWFLPNPKTITVFKASESGIKITYDQVQRKFEKGDRAPWTDYVLTTVDIEHGGKIALMMRDGDNIYIAWTDEDKIHIHDGRLFYTGNTANTEAVDYDFTPEREYDKDDKYNREGEVALSNIDRMKNNYKERRAKTSAPLSRVYLKSIIEGLLKRKDILRIPEEEDIALAIAGNGKYIRFKSDEQRLRENTYGSMKDIIEIGRTGNPRFGEDVYITTKDNGEGRGRGYNNRVYDAYLGTGLSKINLTECTWRYHIRLSVDVDKHLMYDKEEDSWELSEFGKEIKDSGSMSVEKPNYKRKETFDYNNTIDDWDGAYFEKRVHTKVTESYREPAWNEDLMMELRGSWSRRHDGYQTPLEQTCYTTPSKVKWQPEGTEKEPSWFNRHRYIEVDDIWYESIYHTYGEVGFELKTEYTTLRDMVYVSVEKQWGDANANLEVGEGDYINLTLWSSQWVSYAIRNSYTIPYFYQDHFATQLPHLQAILEFLKKREAEFHRWAYDYTGKALPKGWQLKLSQWRIDTDRRNHSEFRMKQFVKYLKEEGEM